MANPLTDALRQLPVPFVRNAAAPGPIAPVAPRKAAPPTSYSSESTALVPPPKLDSELGSSQGTTVREFVPELASAYQRTLIYNQMLNDVGVDVSLRAGKTPVLGAEFYIDPYSEEALDLQVADFVWDNLTGGLEDPFLNSLEDILRMYETGYSVLEKVYELRSWTPGAKGANTKQYTMLKDLAVRPASTHKEIDYDDNGRLIQIIQNAIRANKSVEEVTLPDSKLLVFTFNRQGGDVTGKSLLRTAYPHWYYKVHFYKIDAIQKERHSLGIPKGKLLPGYTAQDKAVLRNLLRNIRANEEAFIIEVPNVEITFEQVHGQLVDVLASADHHNMMILLNVMVQFLGLGLATQGGGGRATGATQSDLFMKSLRYVANLICDVINMELIPELVVWNFPTNNFPKLCVRNTGETRDLQMLAAALGNLLAQDGITPDLETENWMRRVFDMPSKKESDYTLLDTPQQGAEPPPQKGNVKNGKGTGNVGAPPNASR